jgi:hypothetical protein
MDFYFWGCVKDITYSVKLTILEELKDKNQECSPQYFSANAEASPARTRLQEAHILNSCHHNKTKQNSTKLWEVGIAV